MAGIDVLGFCGRKSCGKASSNEVADACSSKSTPTLTPEVKSRIANSKAKAIAKLVERGQGSGEVDTAGRFVFFEDTKGDVTLARSSENGGPTLKKRLFDKLEVYGGGQSSKLTRLVDEEARREEVQERFLFMRCARSM